MSLLSLLLSCSHPGNLSSLQFGLQVSILSILPIFLFDPLFLSMPVYSVVTSYVNPVGDFFLVRNSLFSSPSHKHFMYFDILESMHFLSLTSV